MTFMHDLFAIANFLVFLSASLHSHHLRETTKKSCLYQLLKLLSTTRSPCPKKLSAYAKGQVVFCNFVQYHLHFISLVVRTSSAKTSSLETKIKTGK